MVFKTKTVQRKGRSPNLKRPNTSTNTIQLQTPTNRLLPIKEPLESNLPQTPLNYHRSITSSKSPNHTMSKNLNINKILQKLT
ncbi:unnamed protein product [Moneuplotes crassus]|uniref:Uncharacterized protein n=1 Tax=Euplotes crassus TaxID=5936 RepID=A0AAD1U3L2_EUPCR|nr:unnamed protein product [Moneuplotes crassus]